MFETGLFTLSWAEPAKLDCVRFVHHVAGLKRGQHAVSHRFASTLGVVLNDDDFGAPMSTPQNPYGSGDGSPNNPNGQNSNNQPPNAPNYGNDQNGGQQPGQYG